MAKRVFNTSDDETLQTPIKPVSRLSAFTLLYVYKEIYFIFIFSLLYLKYLTIEKLNNFDVILLPLSILHL